MPPNFTKYDIINIRDYQYRKVREDVYGYKYSVRVRDERIRNFRVYIRR
jgi:hypothetical protein